MTPRWPQHIAAGPIIALLAGGAGGPAPLVAAEEEELGQTHNAAYHGACK